MVSRHFTETQKTSFMQQSRDVHYWGKNLGLYKLSCVRRNQLHWCIWENRTIFNKAGEIKCYKKELLRLKKRIHEYMNRLNNNLLCSPTVEGWEKLPFKRRKPWTGPSPFSSLPINRKLGRRERVTGKSVSRIQLLCCTNTVYYIKCCIYQWNLNMKRNLLVSLSQILTVRGKNLNTPTKQTLYLANYLKHNLITLKASFIQRHGTLSIIFHWTPSVFPFLRLDCMY